MSTYKHKYTLFLLLASLLVVPLTVFAGEEIADEPVALQQMRTIEMKQIDLNKRMMRFTYNSGLHFEYPDAVRGIYVTGHSAGGAKFKELLKLIETTDLNSMVIDVKDDFGHLTFEPDKDSSLHKYGKNYIKDMRKVLKTLEEKEIYPIARITVFKDSTLAEERPDLSFTKGGKVWVNNRGEAFVNPFEKEVWEHNVDVAKLAAEIGFKDIQFDYVRFPEGFEKRDKELKYSLGDYTDGDDEVKRRVEAVTDFVKYAREELAYYDVDVSVDIFGYATTIEEAPGIGQNFTKISEQVDVISSMIYPSHWTPYFGISFPDEQPYQLVTEYAKVENDVLGKLDNPPITRPWIQDFEAPWLYSNRPVKKYGKKEVEDQIRALSENGIKEYLLWNPGNNYSKNVEYIQ